jgi:hypothetical protein
MKIIIGNINKNNHFDLSAAAAIAGYSASIGFVDEVTRIIDIGSEAHRSGASITTCEVERMIAVMICLGFSIQRA